MLRFALVTCSMLAALAIAPAHAADPTPYQKFIGETFVSDLDGQAVTLRLVYDGMVDSNITTLYKNSKINIKDKVFLLHHDPAGQAGAPMMAGGPVMPSFALSLPKASADAILALSPGTLVEISGTAHKSVFGMMSIKTVSVYVEGTAVAAVPPVVPVTP